MSEKSVMKLKKTIYHVDTKKFYADRPCCPYGGMDIAVTRDGQLHVGDNVDGTEKYHAQIPDNAVHMLGPESALDYYEMCCRLYRDVLGKKICSDDMDVICDVVEKRPECRSEIERWDKHWDEQLLDYINEEPSICQHIGKIIWRDKRNKKISLPYRYSSDGPPMQYERQCMELLTPLRIETVKHPHPCDSIQATIHDYHPVLRDNSVVLFKKFLGGYVKNHIVVQNDRFVCIHTTITWQSMTHQYWFYYEKLLHVPAWPSYLHPNPAPQLPLDTPILVRCRRHEVGEKELKKMAKMAKKFGWEPPMPEVG